MRATAFLQRARQEGLRYGEDPYVFLRELAQNGRDAGATRIEVVYTGGTAQEECISFTDNGAGMSFAHAKAFLFRLYASSKEQNTAAAGHFGVGFWSILRWSPRFIHIESRTAAECWGLIVGADGKPEATQCGLSEVGTRIRLCRPQANSDTGDGVVAPGNDKPYPDRESTEALVRRRLHKYCRYLRRASSRRRLPVWFNGERIDEAMKISGPVSMRFSSKEAEGVVGLGEQPRVELYARGLWVTEVSFIEELLPEYDGPTTPVHAGGLSPVVILNSDRIDVTLSRQEPVQGKALRLLVALASERVRRLVGHVADKAFPRPWYAFVGDSWRLLFHRKAPWMVLGWFVFALLNGLLIFGGTRPALRAAPRKVVELLLASMEGDVDPVAGVGNYANISGYRGARVDAPSGNEVAWNLSYLGPPRLFFRALTLSHYDTDRGLLKATKETRGLHPPAECVNEDLCANVRLGVAGARSPLNIPLPTGYAVVPRTVRVDGQPIASSVYANNWGEAWVELRAGASVLEYQVVPVEGPAPLATNDEFSNVPLPKVLSDMLLPFERIRNRKRKAYRIGAAVESLIRYDIRPVAAIAFARTEGPWLQRVLSFGAGDCDVKNGVNVLALRAAGIPARMAVGIPTRGGRAGRGLHAWTEFYADHRWWPIDVSGIEGSRLASLWNSGVQSAAKARRHKRVVRVTPSPRLLSAVRVPPSASGDPNASALKVSGSGKSSELPGRVPADTFSPLSRPLGSDPGGGKVFAHTPARTDGSGLAAESTALPTVPVLKPPHVAGLEPHQERTPLWWLWAATVYFSMLMGIFGLAWRIWKRWYRVSERVAVKQGRGVEQMALARILKDALVQPEAWRGAESLLHRRVLPVVTGRPMSIASALKRAQRGKLWLTRKHSTLAQMAAAKGTAILNAADPVMGEVITALGRGVDLDGVSTMLPAARTDEATARLLIRSNKMLRDAGIRAQCYPAPGMRGPPVADVDISDLKLPEHSGWPATFIAVNPAHTEVRKRATAARVNPDLGTFLFIDWLLDHSELLSHVALPLRRRAAEQILKGDV